jgi:DNA polymerase III alpha subunit (gram-positive type)
MSYIVVDVEADGPVPGLYSMVCFGAVVVREGLTDTFYGKTKPITNLCNYEALAVSGFTRDEHEGFDDPVKVMKEFADWIRKVSVGKPTFFSDNPAFDWQFINYYFHRYYGNNPFGFSGRRIGDLYCGLKKNAGLNSEWKKLYRKTVHDHNPVNDSKGNAEALLSFKNKLGLKINFD